MCDPEWEDELYFTGGSMPKRGSTPRRPQPPRLDRHSPAYFRLQAAGFEIGIIGYEPMYRCGVYTCPFKCVCGRKEMLTFTLDRQTEPDPLKPPRKVDVAKMLEEFGSVGIKHLLNDGYSVNEIRRIRRAYV